MTLEVFTERMPAQAKAGEARLAAVTPVANGLIDAVRAHDARWIADVCKLVASGRVDRDALIVCLAAKAGGDG